MAGFNPLNDRQMQDLRKAMVASSRSLACFRRNRVHAIKQYVGKHYSDDGSTHAVPLPFLELAIDTYHWTLSARVPQVMITPKRDIALRPQGDRMETALNYLFQEEINAYWAFSRVTRNALFGMGIMKCGQTPKYQVEIEGVQHDIGQFFADPVSLDDWVHDSRVKTYEQVSFAGNRYRLPYDLVMQDPLFGNKKTLKPTTKMEGNEFDGGENRAETISRGTMWQPDIGEFKPYVELWDVWLPQENVMVTMPVKEGKPLRIVDWDGPECGPYHLLRFHDVPDQIMPLPPVALWLDMHEFANALYRKAKQQALRQKTITAYQGSAAEDAARIVKADDGATLLSDDPGGVKEYSFGGADPRTIAMVAQSRDLYSWFCGNLDTLAGLSPQAETLGQENLLNANAGKRFEEMQYNLYTFQRAVMRDGAYYTYQDQVREFPVMHRVPKTDIVIPTAWTPEDRQVAFVEYDFSIDPHSLTMQTPASKLRTIANVWERFIAPILPQLEARGITVRLENLLKLIGRYSNLPEIEEIMEFGQEPAGGGETGQGGQPLVTKHVNERINRPGGTRAGRDATLMQTMMGAGSQKAAAAAMLTGAND